MVVMAARDTTRTRSMPAGPVAVAQIRFIGTGSATPAIRHDPPHHDPRLARAPRIWTRARRLRVQQAGSPCWTELRVAVALRGGPGRPASRARSDRLADGDPARRGAAQAHQ